MNKIYKLYMLYITLLILIAVDIYSIIKTKEGYDIFDKFVDKKNQCILDNNCSKKCFNKNECYYTYNLTTEYQYRCHNIEIECDKILREANGCMACMVPVIILGFFIFALIIYICIYRVQVKNEKRMNKVENKINKINIYRVENENKDIIEV